MSTSSTQSAVGRLVSRTDFVIMATGILMFFLSFAPWEGLNAPTIDNVSLAPSVTINAWGAEFSAWFPCLVCLAIALGVGARPRLLLRIVSGVSFALLTIRMLTLAAQHNVDVGQARWGVYIAFIVAAVQLVYVFTRAKVIGLPPAQAGDSAPQPDGGRVA